MFAKTSMVRIAVVCVMAISAAACGGSDEGEAAEDVPPEAAAQDAAQQGSVPADAAAPLTLADIDAYERGMRKEKEIVEDLVRQAENTTDDMKQMELMTAAMEDQTADEGAQAAGLPLDRYRALRNRMSEALGASSLSIMGSALRQQAALSEAQLDTLAQQGAMAPAQIEQSRQNALQMRQQLEAQEKAGLEIIAPDARDAFRERALRLDSLRMVTVGLRVKVAS
jgi:hypothetical protein